MSESKTIPAALETMLRPRRMNRIHGTEAKSRAEGAMFDALLWTVFSLLVVGAIMIALHAHDFEFLAQRDIDETWVVAGSLLASMFVAAALWWRWFKWRVHATILAEREGFEPSSRENP